MYEIIPGILEKEWAEIEKKINLVMPFAKSVHIDIIDGKFTPNISFLDPRPFAKYANDFTLELHMMVENPIQYLEPFAKAGFKRFLGHVESLCQPADQEEFVAKGQLLGEVGLAIDGPTDLSAIRVPLEDLDSILVMAIKAGRSGQVFDPEHLKKIEAIKSKNKEIKIEIDGGVNSDTIVRAKESGATRFVANSFIFRSKESRSQYTLLNSKIS
jgi:ribulose-phosphate 3-epimerase